MKKFKIIKVTPSNPPQAVEFSLDLASLQHEVGGYIQVIYPFDDPVGLICNENAKLDGLPLNRALYDDSELIYDIIAGDFLIVSLSDDGFSSLSDELTAKYLKRFKFPETFVYVNDTIIDIRNILPDSKQSHKS